MSFVQASSHAPAWVKWTPSTPGVVPVPVARQARSSRRQTQPPPVGGHHSHIPVDSGNRLGLVLLDFASSQLSTRFASELPRCPETCRSRQATRQTVPGRRVCDSSPGFESIIPPPPVPRPLRKRIYRFPSQPLPRRAPRLSRLTPPRFKTSYASPYNADILGRYRCFWPPTSFPKRPASSLALLPSNPSDMSAGRPDAPTLHAELRMNSRCNGDFDG